MTVWILLTIALGAISGTAETPLLRSQCANVVQTRMAGEQRVARTVIAYARRLKTAPPAATVARPLAVGVEIPLTGAAAPRAPALSC